jgi:BCCT family betaine/carnitine transporter
VLRGLDGGVKVLSEINMVIAGLLLLFVLFVGRP